MSYDVATTTPEGKRRLRRVAQTCKDFGQRVQYSVFECDVSPAQLAVLRSRLLDAIDPREDSLKLYFLPAAFSDYAESYGRDNRIDYEGPLIV